EGHADKRDCIRLGWYRSRKFAPGLWRQAGRDRSPGAWDALALLAGVMFPIFTLSRPQGWERVPEGRVRALYLRKNIRRKSQQISRKSPHPAFGHLLPLLRNGRRGVM